MPLTARPACLLGCATSSRPHVPLLLHASRLMLPQCTICSPPTAVTVVFSKVDALRLERVVGSARATKMLKSKKTGTFLFC